MEIQKLYQEAIKFASAKHSEKGQKVPGTNLPYDVHISNVTMEVIIAAFNTPNFDLGFAIQVALLHDTIEDTAADFDEIAEKFGSEIAQAISALSKNESLPKEQRMIDCLGRIKKLRSEVWVVKLADRITNLQSPPSDWSKEKKLKYQEEARMILFELGEGNEYLATRLERKIEEYADYI